mgnify:CR=1 FL=1
MPACRTLPQTVVGVSLIGASEVNRPDRLGVASTGGALGASRPLDLVVRGAGRDRVVANDDEVVGRLTRFDGWKNGRTFSGLLTVKASIPPCLG